MSKIDKEALKEKIQNFKLPRYDQLPDVGLYLDQVVKYVNRYTNLCDETQLTPSMISNYVKQKIVPGPSKKSYGPVSIAYLIFVAYTKLVLPLDSIKYMISIQLEQYELPIAYNYFCDELENLLQHIYGLKESPDHIGIEDSSEKALLRSSILAISHKIYLEHYVDLIKNSN